jgi:hypothetical protein
VLQSDDVLRTRKGPIIISAYRHKNDSYVTAMDLIIINISKNKVNFMSYFGKSMFSN